MTLVYFLLLVSLLVVIHELGHFVVAKLLDIRVLRFSLGYGRPLVRFTIGDTQYQLALFPLGGYVRILGVEGDTEDARDIGRSFASRPLWQRLAVVFAGPAANFLLAGVIYFSFFAGHTDLPAAVIGDVLPGGPAANAGLEPGDRVLDIDGDSMRYWEDVEQAVQRGAGHELHVRVERSGKPVEKYLIPLAETVRERDGQSRSIGRVGISHAPFIPLVGVLDPASPAGRAGIATGDLIISVDGLPVNNWTEVTRRLGRAARRTNVVYFRGSELPGVPQVHLLDARFADLVPDTIIDDKLKRTTYTGLERAEMFVAQIDPGSPAEAAGLHIGDLIASLDGQPIEHWVDLDQRLQSDPTRAWTISWKRTEGDKVATMTASVTQVPKNQFDEYGHSVKRLIFGAHNDIARGHGVMTTIDGRFGYAISNAAMRTGETMRMMVAGFASIVAGDHPSDALGGPLTMYQMAKLSSTQGQGRLWLWLALISVNLGLINLLPVPPLDGGHVIVFMIEAVQRRPLSVRARERVQIIGPILLALVTVLALRNDVMKFILR